jgi:hypothetical protein
MRLTKSESMISDIPIDIEEKNYNLSYLPPMIDLILPPNSLYILSGIVRYAYTHEILGKESIHIENNQLIQPYDTNTNSISLNTISSNSIELDRRISIIFRDIHPNDKTTPLYF